MLNTYYDAVKAAVPSRPDRRRRDGAVLRRTPEVTAVDPAWGPLSFMRELFCLSADAPADVQRRR